MDEITPPFRSLKNLCSKFKKRVRFCGNLSCHDTGNCTCPPPNVPHGCLAVYAGREHKRFVIPASYMNHPMFILLLEKAKEEYGFSQKGALNMPFDLILFERFLWLLDHHKPAPSKDLGIRELEQYYMDHYHLYIELIHDD